VFRPRKVEIYNGSGAGEKGATRVSRTEEMESAGAAGYFATNLATRRQGDRWDVRACSGPWLTRKIREAYVVLSGGKRIVQRREVFFFLDGRQQRCFNSLREKPGKGRQKHRLQKGRRMNTHHHLNRIIEGGEEGITRSTSRP
jgi:hypothetical protein